MALSTYPTRFTKNASGAALALYEGIASRCMGRVPAGRMASGVSGQHNRGYGSKREEMQPSERYRRRETGHAMVGPGFGDCANRWAGASCHLSGNEAAPRKRSGMPMSERWYR